MVRALDQLHTGATCSNSTPTGKVGQFNVVRLEDTETIMNWLLSARRVFFKGCGVNLNRTGLIRFTF